MGHVFRNNNQEIDSKKGQAMKKLQILGTGCTKCTQLAENCKTAAEEAGLQVGEGRDVA